MDELQSWFEVPAIAHYFHVFSDAFDLVDFDIEDFEEALLLDSSENVSSFIPDLFICLLRGLYKTKDGLQVTMDNYDKYLQDLLNFHYVVLEKKENPLLTTTIQSLSTRAKVEILYDMINWRLDLEDAMELTKNLEADEMRVEAVGKDNDGNVYWYFYGSRLYKEGMIVRNDESPCQSEVEHKNGKAKKKRKKRVSLSRSGRTIRKKRKVDASSSSAESESESEKSIEVPDEDAASSLRKNEHKPIRLNISLHNWSLTCNTLEEWESLIQQFNSASTKNEKELLTNLKDLFEEIPSIIRQKELKLQKKMLAMAPRRFSDRITQKMQQREMEEKLLEQERLLRKQQKADEEEQRLKQLEEQRAEEREKRYKERERMLEQRSLRAKMREEQRIIRDNPELAATLTPYHPNSSSSDIKEESLSDSEEEETEEEDNEYTSMSIVLQVLKEHDDAWLFLEPVKEEEAPHYYSYIKNPMDFRTIGEKIKGKVYRDKYEFESDVMLIFDNCETYNGTYSPFTKMAFKVKRHFKKLMKHEFPPDVHDNDADFGNNDPRMKAKKTKPTKNNHVLSRNSLYAPKQKVHKPRNEIPVASSEVSTATDSQVKAKALSQNIQKSVASKLSPISATNYLSTKFSIAPNILKQMTPAQMQSLILRYPRPGFVPALQSLMGQKLAASTCSPTAVPTPSIVFGTTTISPLHQLANTALGPPQSPVKVVNIAKPILPKNKIPIVSKCPVVQVANSGVGGQTAQGGYVSGLAASGVPVTAQWDGMKKQIVTQMAPSTSNASNGLPPGKSTSGITVSGSPFTTEWKELKKQLVSQMKKDKSATQISDSSTLSLHPNSCVAGSLSSPAQISTVSSLPSLRPVNMSSAIPLHLSKDLGIATTTIASASYTTPVTLTTMPANLSKNQDFRTSVKPVIIKKPTFDCVTSSPSTTQSFTKTAKITMPNLKLHSGLSKLQNTVIANQSLLNKTSVSPLVNVQLLSGHSKVQDWLQSSSPFIVQTVGDMQSLKSVTTGMSKCTSLSSVGSTNSVHFVGNETPETPPLAYIPKPSLPTPVSKVVPIPLPNVHQRTTSAASNRMNVFSMKGHLASQGKTFSSTVVNNKGNILDLQKAALQAAAVDKISTKLQSHLKKDKIIDNTVPASNRCIKTKKVEQQIGKDLNSSLKRETLTSLGTVKRETLTSLGTAAAAHLAVSVGSTVVGSSLGNISGSQLINPAAYKDLSVPGMSSKYLNVLISESYGIDASPRVVSCTSSNDVKLQSAPQLISTTRLSNGFALISNAGMSNTTRTSPAISETVNSLPLLKTLTPSQQTIQSVGNLLPPPLQPTNCFPSSASTQFVSKQQSTKYSQIKKTPPKKSSDATKFITTLPPTRYSQTAQVIASLPGKYTQLAGNQLVTTLPPSTNNLQSTSTQLIMVMPSTCSQSAINHLITTLPSTNNPHATAAQFITMSSPAKNPLSTGSNFSATSAKFTQGAAPQVIAMTPYSKHSVVPGSQLIAMSTPANSAQSSTTQRIAMLPSSKYPQSAGSQLFTVLPANCSQSAVTQIITPLSSTKFSHSAGTPQLFTVLPANGSQAAGAQLITMLPAKHSQTAGTQLSSMQPSSKYLTLAAKPVTLAAKPVTLAAKPVALQQQSQLIAPSLISKPNTVKFQMISNKVPVLPKPTSISNQATIQKVDPSKGQLGRYILPVQTQLSSGQVNFMSQLGPVQNLYVNNATVKKAQTGKHVHVVSKSSSSLLSQASVNDINLAARTNISAINSSSFSNCSISNETIVMNSSAIPLNSRQARVTSTANTNTLNMKVYTVETSTVCTAVSSSPKNEKDSLLIRKVSDVPQLSMQKQLSDPITRDAAKFLSSTTQSQPNPLQSLHSTSTAGNLNSSDQKPIEPARQVVLQPDQLQKLKDEGCIMMTANGQLVMIPPNLVGNVPSSVFK